MSDQYRNGNIEVLNKFSETFDVALKRFTNTHQISKLREEANELQEAYEDVLFKFPSDENLARMREEMADVIIVAWQLMDRYELSKELDSALARFKWRLRDGDLRPESSE